MLPQAAARCLAATRGTVTARGGAVGATPSATSSGAPPPPVLVVLFNRPQVAAQLIAALRRAQPAQLFVVADGPRNDHANDIELCRQTRAVLDQVDWPCEIRRHFHEHNLGLQTTMVDGIDWFFSQVESGVILEDDCLVHPDFFALARDLLDRYRDEPRVMSISALNMAPADSIGSSSYFFASAGHIWGWATWRRAWEGYDIELASWPTVRDRFDAHAAPLQRALGVKFQAAHSGAKNTWARAWHFHVASHDGLVAIPTVNLVKNIGLGPDATHTTSSRHVLANLPVGDLPRPIVHPELVEVNGAYDATLATFHTWSRRRRLRERLQAISVACHADEVEPLLQDDTGSEPLQPLMDQPCVHQPLPLVVRQRAQQFSESVDVSNGVEHRLTLDAEHLARAEPAVARHDGASRRHRLDEHGAEPFVLRAHHEDRCVPHDVPRGLAPSGELDAIGNPPIDCELFEHRALIAVADQDQPPRFGKDPRSSACLDEVVVPLRCHQPADADDRGRTGSARIDHRQAGRHEIDDHGDSSGTTPGTDEFCSQSLGLDDQDIGASVRPHPPAIPMATPGDEGIAHLGDHGKRPTTATRQGDEHVRARAEPDHCVVRCRSDEPSELTQLRPSPQRPRTIRCLQDRRWKLGQQAVVRSEPVREVARDPVASEQLDESRNFALDPADAVRLDHEQNPTDRSGRCVLSRHVRRQPASRTRCPR